MSRAAAARAGTFIRFRTGTTGASAKHVAYITRERAVVERERGIFLYQLPEHVRAAGDYDELRQTLTAYADVREDSEIARHKARGEARTHYRVTASFERDVPTEKALGMAKEWLEREFPRARGFAAVHRDTGQTHVHVWIDARQIDGKKVQLSRAQHRSLDVSWNRIYSREMGRDPREHERKKEQTREAKREGWQRQQSPEYPERVRKNNRELTRPWERREIGAQAAREWVEHPDGTFLERVRAVAGHDLKEARSWEELDRRLERHGLRIEARGAGMVLTDGKQNVKASSVDREASRGKLEKRFGLSLAEHRARSRDVEGMSPEAREILRDLHTLDRRRWLKADLAREMERLEAARARLDEQRWARERADKASRAFGQALEDVYQEPAKARAAFEERARRQGSERAAEEMRERPEQYGHLREVEQRRLFGLARTRDLSQARERARNAAELGREAAVVSAAAPSTSELTRAEQALRRAELRAREIGRRLEHTRDNSRTQARIGLAMQQLLPREVNDLHRLITAPHRQLTIELERTVQKMAPEHMRELVQWARAPHRQLPASAARAFKGLLYDRTVERGSQ